MKEKIILLALILTYLLSSNVVLSFDCNGAYPPDCQCSEWRINEQFGDHIIIPTGDPTCYYIVRYQVRDCQCGPGYTKHQIKILGLRKEGNCTNVRDKQIMTETYSFLLLIAKDLLGEPLDTFEVDIIAPSCYQWVADSIQSCGDCCRKTWTVHFDPIVKQTEVSSNSSDIPVCSGVASGCRSLCDSVDISDGVINYPAWPGMCLGQDICSDRPWRYTEYAFGVMNPSAQNLPDKDPFVVYYDWKNDESCQLYKVFRIKFIQLASIRSYPVGLILTKALKRILRDISTGAGIRVTVRLLSYSCWSNTSGGFWPQRISPCLDEYECCVIEYTLVPQCIKGPWCLFEKTSRGNGNPACTLATNCYFMCDTLVNNNLIPDDDTLPSRWGRAIAKELDEPTASEHSIVSFVNPNPVNGNLKLVVNGINTEKLDVEVYNILGLRIVQSVATKETKGVYNLALPELSNGFYNYIIKLGGNVVSFGNFVKFK